MMNTQTDTRRNLRDLLDSRAARTGEITLSTGTKSNFYFDCKPVTLSADGAYLVGTAFLDALEQLPERPEAVGGLTHGADPIVSAMVVLSHVRECPIEGFYVRKEAKQHGTKRRIENPPAPGTKVVIVDDVVTTGRSLLQAVEEAREAGCKVIGVLALVDREEQDGAVRIRSEVDPYIPLYTRSDFPRLAGVADPCRTTMTSEQPSIQEASTLTASGA
jgi:orotate phosphoribosyltransferase